MNKLLVMLRRVVIAVSMVGAAYADNISNSWTGLHAGVNAGVVFNEVQLKAQQLAFTNPNGSCDTASDFSSFFPGIQLGYMHQFQNNLVTGIEANVTFNANQNNILSCNCPFNPDVFDRFQFKNQMQSAIKGRGGRALNWNNKDLLPYVTAGASIAHTGLLYSNEGQDYYSKNTTQVGWLIGAGMEWSFRKNWSLRAEYSYVDYGNTLKLKLPSLYGLVDPDGQAQAFLNTNTILIAVNYWI